MGRKMEECPGKKTSRTQAQAAANWPASCFRGHQMAGVEAPAWLLVLFGAATCRHHWSGRGRWSGRAAVPRGMQISRSVLEGLLVGHLKVSGAAALAVDVPHAQQGGLKVAHLTGEGRARVGGGQRVSSKTAKVQPAVPGCAAGTGLSCLGGKAGCAGTLVHAPSGGCRTGGRCRGPPAGGRAARRAWRRPAPAPRPDGRKGGWFEREGKYYEVRLQLGVAGCPEVVGHSDASGSRPGSLWAATARQQVAAATQQPHNASHTPPRPAPGPRTRAARPPPSHCPAPWRCTGWRPRATQSAPAAA